MVIDADKEFKQALQKFDKLKLRFNDEDIFLSSNEEQLISMWDINVILCYLYFKGGWMDLLQKIGTSELTTNEIEHIKEHLLYMYRVVPLLMEFITINNSIISFLSHGELDLTDLQVLNVLYQLQSENKYDVINRTSLCKEVIKKKSKGVKKDGQCTYDIIRKLLSKGFIIEESTFVANRPHKINLNKDLIKTEMNLSIESMSNYLHYYNKEEDKEKILATVFKGLSIRDILKPFSLLRPTDKTN